MPTNNPLNSVFDRMLTLSRAMDQAFPGEPFLGNVTPPAPQLWLPPVDTYETDNAFVIAADLPGVHPENVEINFEQNTLTIQGTRAPTLPAKEKSELRIYTAERVNGAFARSIRLPEYVDGEKIEATFANGVLSITVPKAPSALPRKITVRSATNADEAKKLNG